jgi:predicted DNA-binding protein
MASKEIALRVPIKMFEDLNQIAKKENRPRARIMREMLDRGIKERKNHGS